jgi:hypothetical protein
MPKAEHDITTPTRRTALSGGLGGHPRHRTGAAGRPSRCGSGASWRRP